MPSKKRASVRLATTAAVHPEATIGGQAAQTLELSQVLPNVTTDSDREPPIGAANREASAANHLPITGLYGRMGVSLSGWVHCTGVCRLASLPNTRPSQPDSICLCRSGHFAILHGREMVYGLLDPAAFGTLLPRCLAGFAGFASRFPLLGGCGR